MSAIRHITRVNPPHGSGWMVRLQRNSEPIQRWFADRRYGGRQPALAAAKDWRDRKLARHPARKPRPRVWRDGHVWRGQYFRNGRLFRIQRSGRRHGLAQAEKIVRNAVRRKASR